MENVLVKPEWPSLRQVSLKLSFPPVRRSESAYCLSEALQSLPDKYLNRLLKLESVAFNYSTAYIV